MFSGIQECPECSGMIPREQFAEITADGWPWVVTRMYCEYCHVGDEAVWRKPPPGSAAGAVLVARTVYRKAKNPVDYGKLLQRIESATNNRDLVRAANRDLKALVA